MQRAIQRRRSPQRGLEAENLVDQVQRWPARWLTRPRPFRSPGLPSKWLKRHQADQERAARDRQVIDKNLRGQHTVSVAMRFAKRRVASITCLGHHAVTISRRCNDSVPKWRQSKRCTGIGSHQPLRQQQDSRHPNANPSPSLSLDTHSCESSGEARPCQTAQVKF